MATCGACRSTILFGGTQYGGMRFCNAKCAAQGRIVVAARQVPDEMAREFAARIHRESCPKCSGPGPVDVRKAHSVWSAVYLTQWRSTTHIACRKCGIRHQALSTLTSALFGWWGLPWGLIMTPVQISRNVAGLAKPHDPARPSAELVHQARLILADRALQQGELVV